MNENTEKINNNEYNYRRLLRYLRKHKEAENIEKINNKETNSDQPK